MKLEIKGASVKGGERHRVMDQTELKTRVGAKEDCYLNTEFKMTQFASLRKESGFSEMCITKAHQAFLMWRSEKGSTRPRDEHEMLEFHLHRF
ncbi:hypothetical protein AMTR_s00103p00103830 [Amborella trichopoda]|uniref:Uncharacterized protein n=1 Tax=Amborella trichopoda TaxID=13333 RepID=W1P1M8_AMBTC|nr:hypothetical protein AMTR_s00103p00103830 [Amborella trichopoda]